MHPYLPIPMDMGLDDNELLAPTSWTTLLKRDSPTILSQIENQSLSSWPVSLYGRVCSFLSLPVVEGYWDSPPSALTYRRYSHPRPSYFQLDFSNPRPWDFSSCYLYYSSILALDATSNTSPLYGLQCCSHWNACWYIFTGVFWLFYFYIFPIFSYDPESN